MFRLRVRQRAFLIFFLQRRYDAALMLAPLCFMLTPADTTTHMSHYAALLCSRLRFAAYIPRHITAHTTVGHLPTTILSYTLVHVMALLTLRADDAMMLYRC